MKILMTSSGGIIRGIENWPEHGLARQLVKKGHDVTVISSSSAMRKHDAKKEETINGIKAKRFNPVAPSSMLYAAKNDFDLVHMHHLGYLAPISSYAALARKFKMMPSVFTIHGLYHDPYLVKDVEDPFSGKINDSIAQTFPYLRPWRILNWFVHLPLQADRITALTEWEKTKTQRLGIRPEKIEVIPNGVDTKRYRRGRKDYFRKRGIEGPVLLFVGQPTRRKGWEYFLGSFTDVMKRNPDAKAVFVGYRQDEEMKRRCQALGISKNVIFLGFLPEEEKIDAFTSADMFVLPTLYEGFGIVFLEAMAAGLPVITTDSAGNSEIVHNGENGLLVKPRDTKTLTSAILKLLDDRKLRHSIGKKNIGRARQYDWKTVGRKYIELYEVLV